MNCVIFMFVCLTALPICNANIPKLSMSFHLEGSSVTVSRNGSSDTTSTFTQLKLGVDSERLLYFFDGYLLENGTDIPVFILESANDNLTYKSLGGECITQAYRPPTAFGDYSNVWSILEDAVENPPGTFILNFESGNLVLVIENGLPTSGSRTINEGLATVVTTECNKSLGRLHYGDSHKIFQDHNI